MTYLLGFLTLAFNVEVTQAQTPTPTFESIGIDWKIQVDQDSYCKVAFKKADETAWQQGLNLFTDLAKDEPNEGINFGSLPETEGFRGSIVGLQPNTRYNIKLTYRAEGGAEQQKEINATTWNEVFPTDGEVVTVTSRQDLQSKLNALKQRTSRPAGKYVVFKGDGRTVINGGDEKHAITLEGLSYVILRDLEIIGAKASGIWISESDHIVIENCRIHAWGEPGFHCKNTDSGKDAAIYAESSSHLVVQRNTIKDPRGDSCHWPERGDHPSGPRGIALTNYGNGAGVTASVFRYNIITSSSQDRYFSDVFNAESGGADSDIDVYGNEFANAWDDGVEIEGKNKNIRVWGNVIRNVFSAVASDRVGGSRRDNYRTYYGPVYIWRNIITDLQAGPRDTGDGQKESGKNKVWTAWAFKIDNRKGQGGIYLFNNTISGLASPGGSDRFIKPNRGIVNDGQHNLTVKNNIFDIKNRTAYSSAMRPSSTLNHNAYSNAKENYVQRSREGWETTNLFEISFAFDKGSKDWDYYVVNEELKGKGTRIPNFIDPPAGTPIDLGAAQKDVWSMCVGPEANCNNSTGNPPPPVVDPLLATRVTLTSEVAASLDESFWSDVPGYSFADSTTSPNKSDNQVAFKVAWNNQYLIIGVQVSDQGLFSSTADPDRPWNNDAIDLLLDPQNTSSSGWNPTAGHRQFIIDVRGNQYSDPNTLEVDMPYAASGPDSYFYEMRIPWTSLGDISPADGVSLGFDLANHDRDASDQKTQFSYTGRSNEFRTPRQFTKVVLGGRAPAPMLALPVVSAVTVDGQLDEAVWQNEGVRYQFAEGGSAQTEAWFAWTPDTFYAALRVTDEVLLASAGPAKPWRNDGVELLFDLADNNATEWGTPPLPGHKQLVVDMAAHVFQSAEPAMEGIAVGRTVGNGQYTLEISIPWSSLGADQTPEAGYTVGFDLVTNDRDATEPVLANSVTYTGRQ